MRLIVAFGTLGIVLAAMATRQALHAEGAAWLAVAVEAQCALCLIVLSILYAMRSAGVDVEGLARGSVASWAIRIVLLPYMALGAFSLYLSRWFDRGGLLNPIATGLFVGRLPFPSERDVLRAAGIDAVLNLCWEFPALSGIARDARFEAIRIPILDGAAPTDCQFDEAVRWVASRRAEGRTVLIHCAQGHGRTATLASAVLVRLGMAGNLGDALAMVRAVRPLAQPSRAQEAALRRYLVSPVDADQPELESRS